MNRCVECGGEKLTPVVETDSVTVAGRTFTAEVPALRCEACGKTYLDLSPLVTLDLVVAGELAQTGPADGETFRFMRRALGYTAAVLAELLDVTPETVSHWERGKHAIDRTAWATLAAMVIDRLQGRTETLDRLRALREPPKAATTIHVQLPRAATR